MAPLKILVCGTRQREPLELLTRIFDVIPPGSVIIAGAAKGVDRAAAIIARKRGFQVLEFPANWNRDGMSAGPIRNQEMLDQKPDLVIALHEDPNLGKGTKDMVTRSRFAGVPVLVFALKADVDA